MQAIVETYARTAEPVGSQGLSEGFGYSPATIRAEMAELESLGLITHPHTSAGRIPTDKGYRVYVNHVGGTQPKGRITDVVAKRVQNAGASDIAIKTAVQSLAELTHNLGWATVGPSLFYSGLASLFGQPEFLDQHQSLETARLLDSLSDWLLEASPYDRVSVYIGSENPIGKAAGSSLIIARYASPFSDASYIGVLGPTRQDYRQVMGLVDYTGQLLEETLNA